MSNKRPEFSYIGKCPKCGNYCAVVVDDPTDKKATSRSVAEFVRWGLEISRVDTEFVRQNFSSCVCSKAEPVQLKLF